LPYSLKTFPVLIFVVRAAITTSKLFILKVSKYWDFKSRNLKYSENHLLKKSLEQESNTTLPLGKVNQGRFLIFVKEK
jgi:hypothetical protein